MCLSGLTAKMALIAEAQDRAQREYLMDCRVLIYEDDDRAPGIQVLRRGERGRRRAWRLVNMLDADEGMTFIPSTHPTTIHARRHVSIQTV